MEGKPLFRDASDEVLSIDGPPSSSLEEQQLEEGKLLRPASPELQDNWKKVLDELPSSPPSPSSYNEGDYVSMELSTGRQFFPLNEEEDDDPPLLLQNKTSLSRNDKPSKKTRNVKPLKQQSLSIIRKYDYFLEAQHQALGISLLRKNGKDITEKRSKLFKMKCLGGRNVALCLTDVDFGRFISRRKR